MEVTAPTELLHALLVCFIQEEVALFHSSVHFKTQAQTGILHQLRVDVMDQGLQQETQQLTQHNVKNEKKSHLDPQLTSSLVLSGPDRGISSIFICKSVLEILIAR